VLEVLSLSCTVHGDFGECMGVDMWKIEFDMYWMGGCVKYGCGREELARNILCCGVL